VAGVLSHIENGMDFVEWESWLLTYLRKSLEQYKKNNSLANFITIAKNSCDQDFSWKPKIRNLTNSLFFYNFYETTPKSNALLQDSNDLAVMGFYSIK
jgi:hypothetical protein